MLLFSDILVLFLSFIVQISLQNSLFCAILISLFSLSLISSAFREPHVFCPLQLLRKRYTQAITLTSQTQLEKRSGSNLSVQFRSALLSIAIQQSAFLVCITSLMDSEFSKTNWFSGHSLSSYIKSAGPCYHSEFVARSLAVIPRLTIIAALN